MTMTESVCPSCGRQKHVNASTVCQDFNWHTPGKREDPAMDPAVAKVAKVAEEGCCWSCGKSISSPSEGCVNARHPRTVAVEAPIMLDRAIQKSPSGIPGMGTDAPMAPDGLQALSLYRFDLVDAKAMFAMTKVLSQGAQKYGEGNWRKIGVEDHINHALSHFYAYLAGDTSDDHLTNALCRAMFARGVTLEG